MRQQFIEDSLTIKNEIAASANTANRVGSLFEKITKNTALAITGNISLALESFEDLNEVIDYINERTISQSGNNSLTLSIPIGTFFANDLVLNNINFPIIIEGFSDIVSILKPETFIINNCNITFRNIKIETRDNLFKISNSKINFDNCIINQLLEIDSCIVKTEETIFDRTNVDNSKFNGTIIVFNNKFECFNSEVYIEEAEIDNNNQINDWALAVKKLSKVYIDTFKIKRGNNLSNDVLIEGGDLTTLSFTRDNISTPLKIARNSVFENSNYTSNSPKYKYVSDSTYQLSNDDFGHTLIFTASSNVNLEVSPLYEGFECTIVNSTIGFTISLIEIGETAFLENAPTLNIKKAGKLGQINNNRFYTIGWD